MSSRGIGAGARVPIGLIHPPYFRIDIQVWTHPPAYLQPARRLYYSRSSSQQRVRLLNGYCPLGPPRRRPPGCLFLPTLYHPGWKFFRSPTPPPSNELWWELLEFKNLLLLQPFFSINISRNCLPGRRGAGATSYINLITFPWTFWNVI